MAQPRFTNPVDGPRIVPRGEERLPTDKLDNGRDAFRVTSTFAEHAASQRPVGTDIGNFLAGDPVLAMAPGTVVFTEPTKEGIVRIDHGDGWSSGYGHMDGLTVSKGQSIPRGHPIGKVGKRGTDQVHLHFDVTHNGIRMDPWPLLEQNMATDDFEPLGTLIVIGGTNLRKEPSVTAREHFIATDSRFDLLGVKPDGGAWSAGGQSGTSWYRIRRESDWWVYTGGAKAVALTKWGAALIPVQPAPDCTEQVKTARFEGRTTMREEAIAVAVALRP